MLLYVSIAVIALIVIYAIYVNRPLSFDMYGSAFVKLVEDEYKSLLRNSNYIKAVEPFRTGELPEHICSEVQRFRNWLTLAVRTTEVSVGGREVDAADILIHAASSTKPGNSDELIHNELKNALTLFKKDDFEAIFGNAGRTKFESRAKVTVSECQFAVCHEHCQLVRKLLDGQRES